MGAFEDFVDLAFLQVFLVGGEVGDIGDMHDDMRDGEEDRIRDWESSESLEEEEDAEEDLGGVILWVAFPLVGWVPVRLALLLARLA